MNLKTTNQKKIAGSFDNNYIKYKIEGAEDCQWSTENIRSYFCDIINNLKNP